MTAFIYNKVIDLIYVGALVVEAAHIIKQLATILYNLDVEDRQSQRYKHQQRRR